MLTRITFTGADDKTNPLDMAQISARYPFCEWGILIGSRMSAPRMPSRDWINALLNTKTLGGDKMNLSLHVCGAPLRTIAAGRSIIGEGADNLVGFDRVQLNWHGDRQGEIGLNIANAFTAMRITIDWEPEVIFQGDEANAAAGLHRETANMGFPVSMLFDCSHGAGILPRAWPKSIPDLKTGWAGGIGPDNVLAQMTMIRAAYNAGGSTLPYWFDMETKVRTESTPKHLTDPTAALKSGEPVSDFFDLAKVVHVCQMAERYVTK